jgi:patatin-like phospholipase/acyl hydrolase
LAGGGAFGASQSYFLRSLDIDTIFGHVDALGGASVGSEIACALASGKTPSEVHICFMEAVYDIFKQPFFPTIKGARYDTKVLQKHLKILIPCKYGGLKIPVIIPTLNFELNKMKVYDNIGSKNPDLNYAGFIPATQSSSAPTYFDPFKGCVDGGLIENLPIMTTVTALHNKLGIRFEDMNILAIGTGHKVRRAKNMNKVKKWFVWQWLTPMLEMLTEANEMASLFWAKEMPFYRFRYFNEVILKESWKMDKPKVFMDELLERCEAKIHNFGKAWDEFQNA